MMTGTQPSLTAPPRRLLGRRMVPIAVSFGLVLPMSSQSCVAYGKWSKLLSSPCFGLASPCSGYVTSRGVSVPSSSFRVSAPCPAARLPLIFPWQTSAPSRVVPLHALTHSVHHHHAPSLHSHSIPPNFIPSYCVCVPPCRFLFVA